MTFSAASSTWQTISSYSFVSWIHASARPAAGKPSVVTRNMATCSISATVMPRLFGVADSGVRATFCSSGYRKGEFHETPCFLVQRTGVMTSIGKGDEALPDLRMRFANLIGGTGWFRHRHDLERLPRVWRDSVYDRPSCCEPLSSCYESNREHI